MDRSKALCLACSSSLPPAAHAVDFTTPCCNRVICPACLTSNPRLARYNPCIACLSGVGTLSGSKTSAETTTTIIPKNIDGGVRDEDVFTLGDDEDEEQDDDHPIHAPASVSPSTTSSVTVLDARSPSSVTLPPDPTVNIPAVDPEPGKPWKYYVKKGDTVNGLALRFGLDVCHLVTQPPCTAEPLR
jgi:hypothetical protein